MLMSTALTDWQGSPELQLLLAACRVRFSEDDGERLRRALAEPLDWQRVLELCKEHRVTPLLERALRREPLIVPRRITALLRRDADLLACRNLTLVGELVALLDELEAVGIPALPLKGPVLAQDVYGSITQRQFGDLDLMVAPEQAARARDLLVAKGYVPSVEVRGSWERAHLRFQHHHKCVRADGQEREIHWAPATRAFSFPLTFEQLWEARRTIPLAGRQIPTLSREHQLLSLAMHGATHCWERLSWICDIAELLRVHSDLDWTIAHREAARLGSRRVLALAVALARELLGAEAPASAAALDDDPAVAMLVRNVAERLSGGCEDFPDTLDGKRFHLRMRERLRDRIAYFLYNDSVVPHVCDREFLRLPDFAYPAYYLIKPVRLLAGCFARPNPAQHRAEA